MKKFIAIFMAMILALCCFVSCKRDDVPTDTVNSETEAGSVSDTEEESVETEEQFSELFQLGESVDGVKTFGVRNIKSDFSVRMDWVGSGAEFAIDFVKEDVRLEFIVTGECNVRIHLDC